MAAMTGAMLAELQARLSHSTVAAALRYQRAAQRRDAEIAAKLSDLARPPQEYAPSCGKSRADEGRDITLTLMVGRYATTTSAICPATQGGPLALLHGVRAERRCHEVLALA